MPIPLCPPTLFASHNKPFYSNLCKFADSRTRASATFLPLRSPASQDLKVGRAHPVTEQLEQEARRGDWVVLVHTQDAAPEVPPPPNYGPDPTATAFD